MPGFTIHIAIAKEYAQKHKKEIINEEEFVEGTISPDYISIINPNIDKDQTHYGIWGKGFSIINIKDFLNDPKVDLKKDYWKGYYLHLIVDHYFYNVRFKKETEEERKNGDGFYHDYDCLNSTLIDKYKINKIEKIEKYMNCKNDKTKYLNIEKIIEFIEEMSNINLDEMANKGKL